MPYRCVCLLLLWFCALVPLAWAEALTIRVRQASLVQGVDITIGDVAEVQGGDPRTVAKVRAIVIGQAPAAGEERSLYGGYIATRLKQHGFDPQQWQLSVPEKIRVTRASQRLEGRTIEAEVERAIKQQTPWEANKATIRDIRGIDSVVLPPGTVQYEVTFLERGDFLGPTSFSILLRVDGNVEARMYGTAYIDVLYDVVTVVRPIDRHEVLTAADVRLIQVKQSQPLRQVLTRVEDVVGKRAKRPLRANEMVRTYEVEAQPVVRKGDVVLIVVESARLKVSTLGEVLEPGEQGATIRVRNTASKREVRAVVVDSKTVRVPF
jgi:flagellar basal body P-ring formation protein FlgA